jgi:Tfp pilus assembly protein PilZ
MEVFLLTNNHKNVIFNLGDNIFLFLDLVKKNRKLDF